jgi:hypothetical protein
MGPLLLHNPWIQFYVLFVGALWIVFLWDYYLRTSRSLEDRARAK